MQKSKRLEIIKDYMKTHKDVQINEFSKVLDVSESTIRRDIKKLAKAGFLKELYGSIVLIETRNEDILLYDRLNENVDAKDKIGKKAARLIEDNSLVYLDAGSTTFHMVKFIRAKNVRFVTNGINIGLELLRHGLKAHIIGGEMKLVTLAIIGEQAVDSITNYQFDLAFIGANGVDKNGYSTPDPNEGVIKKQAIKNSKQAIILADSSKLNITTKFQFAKREQARLISEINNEGGDLS
jgi:DeoR family transcriptional regulator, fructose operon transcriptional repressor